jgi:hypothetical protein
MPLGVGDFEHGFVNRCGVRFFPGQPPGQSAGHRRDQDTVEDVELFEALTAADGY